MSKVICEICGTAYPDTENECPVCGFEKSETAEIVTEDVTAAAASSPVRGGRFSKGNVSKKQTNSGKRPAAPVKKKNGKKRKHSDLGLIIAIVVLLLAIAGTTGYIYFTYFAPAKDPVKNTDPASTTTAPSMQTLPNQTEGTTEAPDLSCTGLTLYEESVVLNQIGSQWLLNVVPTPANTTDVITYVSADESVATVSEDGKITAVASGETVITITCGNVSVECNVVCQLAETTEPDETEPDTTEPEETEPEETEPEETEPEETKPEETKPQGDFKFNTKYYQDGHWDVTMSVGDTWSAYKGDIDVEDIQWSVGNTSVATVKNGRVKAVGTGWTTLRAVYNGVEYKCIINVK